MTLIVVLQNFDLNYTRILRPIEVLYSECSTVTLLKIRYNTRFFVSEKKLRGRGRGIKLKKKLKGTGQGIRTLKKRGNEGLIFALIVN